MIPVTKLNQQETVVNCDLIELIEANPDTTITMTTGRKLIITDSVDSILEKIVAYKRQINATK
ncbi:MAG: flagellar FlbD family protein [Defluviitaleaceae bacterium]|nr:flagellar FlbD family protein [Defluviitaleaceae bacterium]